jgi:hypothetical protein
LQYGRSRDYNTMSTFSGDQNFIQGKDKVTKCKVQVRYDLVLGRQLYFQVRVRIVSKSNLSTLVTIHDINIPCLNGPALIHGW